MNKKEYLLVSLLAIFLILFGVIFASSYLISVMIAIGLLTMTLIGLDLMFGYCGQVNFGHQGFYAVGGYVSAVLAGRFGVSPILTLVFGFIMSSLVAYLMGRILFRLKGYYFILATLVFGLVIYYAGGAFSEWTGGMTGLSVPTFSVGALIIKKEIEYYCLVWVIVIIMLTVSMNIVRGRIGRALKAISVSEIAAETLGIDVNKYLIWIYVLGAVFASIAGSLHVHHERFVVPYYFSIGTMITMFVALCIGGKGTIWGSLLGATIVTLLPEFMHMFKTYSTFFYGIIFILTLTLLPDGLAGVVKKISLKINMKANRPALKPVL